MTPLASCRSCLEGLQAKSKSCLRSSHKRLWQVEFMFPWCFVAAGTRIALSCTLAEGLFRGEIADLPTCLLSMQECVLAQLCISVCGADCFAVQSMLWC